MAIKYYNLGLDLDVLDECIGLTIVPILDNAKVQKIKNDYKTQLKIDDLYSQLDKFYPSLKKLERKRAHNLFHQIGELVHSKWSSLHLFQK